jgi:predicted TPR repeat methyltransferase
VSLALPPVTSRADVIPAAAAILAGIGDGEVTPLEAQDILKVLTDFDRLMASAHTPGRPPSAGAEAGRQPQGPAETCRSSEAEVGADGDNVAALDGVPTSAARPGPVAAVDAEAGQEPRASADACISPEFAAEAGGGDVKASDVVPPSPATPDQVSSETGKPRRQPPAAAESCKSPESANGADRDDAGDGDAPKPRGSDGTLATGTSQTKGASESAAGRAAGADADRRNMDDTTPSAAMPVRAPPFGSSGDLIADRRYGRARDYAAAGDLSGAAELLLQVLELAPNFTSAWFALGDIRDKTEDRPGAIAAFRKCLDVDRGDRHGAALRLVRLGVASTAQPMSPNYVRALFDQYAPRFEARLVDGLSYRGPEVLRRAVETVAGAGASFERMIDLGCGSGLAGQALAPLCRTAVGVDLSPAMIELARRKGVYVDLRVGDMTELLAGEPVSSADLVVAADAFIYLADLEPICREAARVLMPRGLFAFTVETHPGNGVILGETLRYAHATGHVRGALDVAGLGARALDPLSIRHERGVAAPGLVVVAEPLLPPSGRSFQRHRS